MGANDDWRDGVPNWAGAFAGGAAAGALGWKAGAVAGEHLTDFLPEDTSPMIGDGLENGLAALGMFGLAYVGYRLGLRKPAESVLIAGAGVAALSTQAPHPMAILSWGNTLGGVFAHHDTPAASLGGDPDDSQLNDDGQGFSIDDTFA